jgi:HEXXH motif-containing protein
MRRHRISSAAFAGLATSGGGAEAVLVLREAQLSKHLMLLKYIVAEWSGDPAERDLAVSVLSDAQSRSPQTVAELLRDPMVGSWAAWTCRRIRGAVGEAPLLADLGHLAAIAASAAVATGLDAELTTYARKGSVMVPTLGAAHLPVPDLEPVRLRVGGGSLRAVGGGRTVVAPEPPCADAPGWHGLRRLGADVNGRQASVSLEDLDPYRGRHHIPAADRVAIGPWQETFTQAWDLLTRYAPARADELTVGLRSIVPLADAGSGPARSATVRDVFGSFGLTAPESPADFAVTLVHEFQHSKLSALLDLLPLYDTAHTERYYAPWRLDPRPIGGLLQGVYAFVAVADTWRLLRRADGLEETATREFANIREQVDHALGSLFSSEALTPDGLRFAAGLRDTMDRLMSEPLPADVETRARTTLARNRERWLRRGNHSS